VPRYTIDTRTIRTWCARSANLDRSSSIHGANHDIILYTNRDEQKTSLYKTTHRGSRRVSLDHSMRRGTYGAPLFESVGRAQAMSPRHGVAIEKERRGCLSLTPETKEVV
jgi:hypothetical protein